MKHGLALMSYLSFTPSQTSKFSPFVWRNCLQNALPPRKVHHWVTRREGPCRKMSIYHPLEGTVFLTTLNTIDPGEMGKRFWRWAKK